MGKRITPDEFARTYIDSALDFARNEIPTSVDYWYHNPNIRDFEEYIQSSIPFSLNGSFNQLSCFFHWAFFNNPNSPLEYIQPAEIPEGAELKPRIGLKREIRPTDRNDLLMHVLYETGDCFLDKFEKIFQ